MGRGAAVPQPGVRRHPPRARARSSAWAARASRSSPTGSSPRSTQARAAAGGKDVAIAGGGTLVKQALELGLLDELELHIVPVILGDGQRLLDVDLGAREGIELVPERTIHTPEVTHIRYRVEGRAPLVLDDRGGKYKGLADLKGQPFRL